MTRRGRFFFKVSAVNGVGTGEGVGDPALCLRHE